MNFNASRDQRTLMQLASDEEHLGGWYYSPAAAIRFFFDPICGPAKSWISRSVAITFEWAERVCKATN
jgi:hypothetical protein